MRDRSFTPSASPGERGVVGCQRAHRFFNRGQFPPASMGSIAPRDTAAGSQDGFGRRSRGLCLARRPLGHLVDPGYRSPRSGLHCRQSAADGRYGQCRGKLFGRVLISDEWRRKGGCCRAYPAQGTLKRNRRRRKKEASMQPRCALRKKGRSL